MNDKISNLTIPYNNKIIDALKKMDSLNRKLLILEKDNNFYSLLSIGDIQRAIIRNIDLNTPVYKIVRKDIKIAKKSDDFSEIKKIMMKYRMEFLPVIDNNKVCEVYFWEDIFSVEERITSVSLNVPVIIMAGGEGTRLKPITNVIPKPLIPIGDKTILEIIFDKFSKYGVKDFYISVNYKHELIEYYLSQKNLKNINIRYIKEDRPLGTAGSLSLVKNEIDQRCFITNCDILINQDYKELLDFHIESKNLLTIVGVLKSEEISYGVIEKDDQGNVLKINEKPSINYIINSGMYILEKEAFDYIPENTFFDMTDLISKLINDKKKVSYFPVSEKSWFDIGEWDKYHKTLEEYEKFKNFFG
jgi:dTDP-glucose pyrophosphorylase